MEWSDGYVADVDYTADFFRELSPEWLNFTCLLNGVEPVPLDAPFTYFELGCGQGVTLSILAASNPLGQFFGNDFMPSHIAAAHQFATAADIENLTLLEKSFAELADGAVSDLPQFDFITLHGVYTWINAENQAHIIRFINRYLKPGGIVYASYNAMPGWNAELPLKRLLLAHAALYSEKSAVQLSAAANFIEQFQLDQGGFFSQSTALPDLLALLKTRNPNYLAHEYLHTDTKPLYHMDIVKDFDAAKLNYIGSADLCYAYPSFYLNDEKRALVDVISNPPLRETLKDFFLNSYFRRDVFVRGARALSPTRQRTLLGNLHLALLVPAATLRYTDLKVGVTEACINKLIYAPAFALLDETPATLADLATMPDLQQVPVAEIAKVAAILVTTQQAIVYAKPKPATAVSRRVNHLLALEARYTDACDTFACPIAGNGITLNIVERLVYLLLCEVGTNISAMIAVDAVDDLLEHRQRRLRKDGKPIESDEENFAEITRHVHATLLNKLPIWQHLGLLERSGAETQSIIETLPNAPLTCVRSNA